MIESEEDDTEEGHRFFVQIGLELRTDIDDVNGTDSRE